MPTCRWTRRCFRTRCQLALKPARKRKLVDTVEADRKVSIRRACSVLKIDRSLYVHKTRRGEQAELKVKIKDICQTRERYGYRRVHVLIKRDGWLVNPKRIYCLYKEMDLQLRNKVPKRRVRAKLRADRTEPTHSNHVWAMDFVHDQLATGRKIRVLATNASHLRGSGRYLLVLLAGSRCTLQLSR